MAPKLSQIQKLELMESWKMKAVQLHEQTQKLIRAQKNKNDPENSQLGLKKIKNGPKIKSNSKVRIERIIENESCSTT